MGTVPKEQSRLVMKLFVVLALAAAAVAEPEADPLLYKAYRPWGYGSLGYGVHHPLATAGHHVVGYPAFGYAGHYIGKREAEAEPAADADAYYYNYGHHLGYSGIRGFGYGGVHGLGNFGYRSFGSPYATRHLIGKREAEADPALLLRSNVGSYYSGVGHSGVVPYTGFGYSGVGYAGYPYRPTGYSGMYSYGFGK